MPPPRSVGPAARGTRTNNLGNALKDQGSLNEAIACYRRAWSLNRALPPCTATCSVRCSTTMPQRRRRWPKLTPRSTAGTPSANATPTSGMKVPPRATAASAWASFPPISGAPRRLFFGRALENLDRGRNASICYSDGAVGDALTARLRAAATCWRDAFRMSDRRLAEQIRADRIDILFDLAGHTAHNRLLLFAQKPAPVQVTWAGYVGTTGLEAMDYLLADRYEVPPGASSTIGSGCYECPTVTSVTTRRRCAPVSVPPAASRGFATFGSFSNPAKIGPRVVEAWARILGRVPGRGCD